MKKTKINSLGARKIAMMAMLAAVSIVCGKYLAINAGEVLRFSLENMPVIFAGMVFGPWVGAIVGGLADVVGCLMVGYTINPIVTVGAVAVGAVGGVIPLILKNRRLSGGLVTAISVFCAHLVGSVLIKTPGLWAYYSMPFGILLLWRMLNYLIVGIVDGVIIHALLSSKGIKMEINRVKEEKK